MPFWLWPGGGLPLGGPGRGCPPARGSGIIVTVGILPSGNWLKS